VLHNEAPALLCPLVALCSSGGVNTAVQHPDCQQPTPAAQPPKPFALCLRWVVPLDRATAAAVQQGVPTHQNLHEPDAQSPHCQCPKQQRCSRWLATTPVILVSGGVSCLMTLCSGCSLLLCLPALGSTKGIVAAQGVPWP